MGKSESNTIAEKEQARKKSENKRRKERRRKKQTEPQPVDELPTVDDNGVLVVETRPCPKITDDSLSASSGDVEFRRAEPEGVHVENATRSNSEGAGNDEAVPLLTQQQQKEEKKRRKEEKKRRKEEKKRRKEEKKRRKATKKRRREEEEENKHTEEEVLVDLEVEDPQQPQQGNEQEDPNATQQQQKQDRKREKEEKKQRKAAKKRRRVEEKDTQGLKQEEKCLDEVELMGVDVSQRPQPDCGKAGPDPKQQLEEEKKKRKARNKKRKRTDEEGVLEAPVDSPALVTDSSSDTSSTSDSSSEASETEPPPTLEEINCFLTHFMHPPQPLIENATIYRIGIPVDGYYVLALGNTAVERKRRREQQATEDGRLAKRAKNSCDFLTNGEPRWVNQDNPYVYRAMPGKYRHKLRERTFLPVNSQHEFYCIMLTQPIRSYRSCSFSEDEASEALRKSLWTTAGFPFVTEPIRVKYDDPKAHFRARAALMLEESRDIISQSIPPPGECEARGYETQVNAMEDGRTFALPNLTETEEYDVCRNFLLKLKPIPLRNGQKIRPGTIVLLSAPSGLEFLGSVRWFSSMEFDVNVFLPGGKGFERAKDNETTGKWKVLPFAGLLPQQRVFSANLDLMRFDQSWKLLEEIRSPLLPDQETESVQRQSADEEEKAKAIVIRDKSLYHHYMNVQRTTFKYNLPKLNESQDGALQLFCSSPQGSVTIVQGPPGTGKSTLLVHTILRLVDEDELNASHWTTWEDNHDKTKGKKQPRVALPRKQKGDGRPIMVTAPTNKALLELATRVVEKLAAKGSIIRVAIVGEEEKLFPEEYNRSRLQRLDILNETPLRTCFAHDSWRNVKENYEKMFAELQKLGGHSVQEYARMSVLSKELARRIRLFTCTTSVIAKLADGVSSQLEVLLGMCQEISKDDDFAVNKSKRCVKALLRVLKELFSEFSDADAERRFVQSSHIIFCTVSSAGGSIFRGEGCDQILIGDLILDEASALAEAELSIPMLLQPRRLLAVGDPKQLPASVQSQMAKNLGLAESLQERFMNRLHFKHKMLKRQYRMRPDISLFPATQFYEGKLKDAEVVHSDLYRGELPLLGGEAFAFLDVDGKEAKAAGDSTKNPKEAQAIVSLLQRLARASGNSSWCSSDRVRVITFYQAQVVEITRELKRRRMPSVTVTTVDSSQGCEADLVIVSFVRSGAGGIGFLRDERRLNVALTRAKHELICVGNVRGINRVTGDSAVKKLVENAMERKCIYALKPSGELVKREVAPP